MVSRHFFLSESHSVHLLFLASILNCVLGTIKLVQINMQFQNVFVTIPLPDPSFVPDIIPPECLPVLSLFICLFGIFVGLFTL